MDGDFLDALRDASVYPERPDRVEIEQTHLSVVCLAGASVYKLKKAIRLPFADFSTLEKRRFYCEEECRLNRRLCPDVYLGVVALRRTSDGAFTFGEGGAIIDYAVLMKRLPAKRMLDVLLAEDAVSAREIEAVAATVTAFHAAADRGPATMADGAPEKLMAFALANFEETRALVSDIFPRRLHAALEKRTDMDFLRILPLLRKRAAEGRVVDGHGDLHARNICMTDPPAIYDCIEFEPALRCGDVLLDHAFLVMDLRFRGHRKLAEAYLSKVRDEDMPELMPTLTRYRAVVRAKVSAIAAGEAELSPNERREAAENARRYLRLAAAFAVEEEGPWWIICCGLPAAGKSHLAAALQDTSGGAWPVFASDRIRKELAGVGPEEKLPDRFYTPEFSDRTYGELRDRAAGSDAPVIILDANFRSRAERDRAVEAAGARGAKVVIAHLEAGDETIIPRLRRRAREAESVSDADEGIYRKLKPAFEAPCADEADRLVHLAGNLPAEDHVDRLLVEMISCYGASGIA